MQCDRLLTGEEAGRRQSGPGRVPVERTNSCRGIPATSTSIEGVTRLRATCSRKLGTVRALCSVAAVRFACCAYLYPPKPCHSMVLNGSNGAQWLALRSALRRIPTARIASLASTCGPQEPSVLEFVDSLKHRSQVRRQPRPGNEVVTASEDVPGYSSAHEAPTGLSDCPPESTRDLVKFDLKFSFHAQFSNESQVSSASASSCRELCSMFKSAISC